MPKISAKPAAAAKGKERRSRGGPRRCRPRPIPPSSPRSSSGSAPPIPSRSSELEYVDPFTLLVAVVLSAQATDAGVNKATRALFAVADTPQKMLALGEERLRDMIKTIGLYRNKAKNVIALSAKLVQETGGEVPRSREILETLPGVGRKTANVVLNTAFGEPTIAVDTHVFRVANRIPLAPGKTPLDVERGLEKIVPARIQAPRPSLARSARPLRLQGAPARMRTLHHRGLCAARRKRGCERRAAGRFEL